MFEQKSTYTTKNTKLIVVVGCMGSGKTTEIIRLARKESIKKNVLCIGHSNDIGRQQSRRKEEEEVRVVGRYSIASPSLSPALVEEGFIETHDGGKIPALIAGLLAPIMKTIEYNNADVIVIDEAQFFPDLTGFVEWARRVDGKDIIVGALDGDSEMNPFFDIGYILPRSTRFKKLSAFCAFCGEECGQTRAMFEKQDKVHVGGIDKDYAPSCYLHINMSLKSLPPRTKQGNCIVK